ncbi:MAG: hypothetical protein M5U33_00090 [Pseudorhodoplanes sp.]|nr:hypothetical protein [Pseudorhodoplanes sp.]
MMTAAAAATIANRRIKDARRKCRPCASKKADADQRQKACRNRMREAAPEHAARDAEIGKREEFEIPEEMIDRHRGQRRAAQDVHEIDAARRRGVHHDTVRRMAAARDAPGIDRPRAIGNETSCVIFFRSIATNHPALRA